MPPRESHNNREERFICAAKSIKESIIRNRDVSENGLAWPVLVEGIKDVKSLREIGFVGQIETINRGWDRSRMIAYLSTFYDINAGDIIMTGTPAGVGPVVKGDKLVGCIEKLNSLKVTVV